MLGWGIAYTETSDELSRAIHNFRRHVNLGGALLIDPWGTVESFDDGEEKMRTWDGRNQDRPRLNGRKVARHNVVHLRGQFSVTEYHYLIASRGGDVKNLSQSHRLRLYTRKQIFDAIQSEGFVPHCIENGLGASRDLFVGTLSG